jgi:RNA polymerase sigma-70 factor, ECF subfamily
MESRMQQATNGVPFMATTALGFSRTAIPIASHQENVQELTELVTHHSRRFQRIALAHLGNVADAEDVVQEALLAALTHVDQFRGEAKMSTWLTSIVINTARMKLRKRSPLPCLPLEETVWHNDSRVAEVVADTRPGPEAEYSKREIAEILARASLCLSPVLRRTFELRDVSGLSIRETARLMRVPSGTVKARLARARKKLKTMIAKSTRQAVCQ